MPTNLNTIFQGLFGISQIQRGADIAQSGANLQAQTILQGGNISAQGSALSAAGFRQSARAVQGANKFNLALDTLNTHRQLESMRRQATSFLANQRSQFASTGFAQTSKSFLQLQDEAMTTFEREILNTKLDAENVRRAKIFESEVTQTNLENQARAQEFAGKAAQHRAATQAQEARFQGEIAQFRADQKTASAIPTLLGQILGK